MPQHQIGAFANGDRPDMCRNAMRDGRVDGVFGDIALDPHIVIVARFRWQASALYLHLVRRLPGADDDFANAAHGLTVRGDDRKRPHVMKDVFSSDRLASDAAFGKGNILGDGFVQMMTDHQHVQMFLQRVHRIGTRRIGR